MIHYVDPSMATGSQHDIRENPAKTIRKLLGGHVRPGAVSWPARRDPMLAIFNKMVGTTGKAALQLDPVGCASLIQALSHRWYYRVNPATGAITRDLPMKPNPPWADLGDAFCYWVGGILGMRDPADRAALDAYYRQNRQHATTAFDPVAPGYGYRPPQKEGNWLRTYTPRKAWTGGDDDE